jgi:hypothetical protein
VGRRDASPQLTVIFWRDIPAQVKARAGRERVSAPLPDRFMLAVDAAATVAGKTNTDDYIAEWREETRNCDADLQTEVDGEVTRIDETYPPERVRAMVRNGGWRPSESP